MPVEEAIDHNIEGRLVPMDDPSTPQEVLKLLASPEDRSRLGAAARRRALLYDQRLTLTSLTSNETRSSVQAPPRRLLIEFVSSFLKYLLVLPLLFRFRGVP